MKTRTLKTIPEPLNKTAQAQAMGYQFAFAASIGIEIWKGLALDWVDVAEKAWRPFITPFVRPWRRFP